MLKSQLRKISLRVEATDNRRLHSIGNANMTHKLGGLEVATRLIVIRGVKDASSRRRLL